MSQYTKEPEVVKVDERHSQEPWTVTGLGQDGWFWVSSQPCKHQVGKFDTLANAHRTAECVSALAGFPDPAEVIESWRHLIEFAKSSRCDCSMLNGGTCNRCIALAHAATLESRKES